MADRTVLIRLRANVSDFNRGIMSARTTLRGFHDEIDKTNDRTAWLAQGILAITPAVTTLGAGAVPVISGLATQMTLAVGAAGTMALAFNGVGDALGALNDYQLEPTEANIAKLNEAMSKIGPDGQEFVEFLDSIGPQFSELANISRAGIFPGVTEGIEHFLTLMPEVRNIIGEISEGIGELAGDTGEGLTGSRWEEFFTYLETDGKRILVEMGHTLGGFATGLVQMMVAFGPLTADFSTGLERMSAAFADWADGLSESDGFEEFLDYVQESGPKALDFFGALVMAIVELLEAAAPIGAVMLPQLTNLLEVLGAFANTPLGPLTLSVLALTSAWGRLNAIAAITGSGVLGKATKGLTDSARSAASSTRSVSLAGASWKDFGNTLYNATIPTSTLVKNVNSLDRATGKHALSALKARSAMESWSNRAKGAARNVAPLAGQAALAGIAMSGLDNKLGLTNTTALALAGSLAGPWGTAVGASAGLLLDMKAGADAATQGLKGIDEAVKSKNIEELTARIQEAKEELADQDQVTGFGDFFSDALRDVGASGSDSVTDVYIRKIEEAEAELAGLKNTRSDVAADRTYYNSIQAETAVIEDNIAAMRSRREEALRAFSAETNYAQAILDAKDAFKENGATLDLNTEKGLNNRRALEGIASGWNGLSDSQKNAKGAFKSAQETLYDQAIQFGATEKEARRYVRKLLEIPPRLETKIDLEVDEAARRLRLIRRAMDAIDHDIVIGVSIRGGGGGELPYLSGAIPHKADGGTIRKTGLPYADRHLIMAADGEEVTSNRRGQSDRYRPVLKAINADMPRHVIKAMLADGGTVGWSGAMAAGPSIDYERLAGALSAMRPAQPLYGDVTVIDGYGGFKKQLEEDHQRAGHGGFG